MAGAILISLQSCKAHNERQIVTNISRVSERVGRLLLRVPALIVTVHSYRILAEILLIIPSIMGLVPR